jgi:hypothetical protein
VDETDNTDGNSPLSLTELHQLEARVNARFQAVNARFIAVDGRFAQLGDRVGEIEQSAEALQGFERRTESRFRSLDKRLDATRTQLDRVRLQLSSQIDHAHSRLRRILVLGLLGVTLTAVTVCLCTLVFAQ